MLRALSRLYSKRIVNVNVNILLAGFLALGPAVVAVKLTYMWFGVTDGEQLSHPQRLAITGVTFVTDITFDVIIYFVLHWLANHLPQTLKKASGAVVLDAEHVPFMKDASVVQLQRALISPVLYIGWLGTQYLLIGRGVAPWRATLIGWFIGIVAARTLHTTWMIRTQRSAHRKLAAAVNAIVPGTMTGPPTGPVPAMDGAAPSAAGPAPETPASGSAPPRGTPASGAMADQVSSGTRPAA